MTCRELSESLLDYRCGALNRTARVDFDAHQYAADYDAVVHLVRDAVRTPGQRATIPDLLVKRIVAAAPAQ